MGISTWRYRGSDLERERTLERGSERTLIDLTVNGNRGFKAYDDDACSVYVGKGCDVITWSVQTNNPACCRISVRSSNRWRSSARTE